MTNTILKTFVAAAWLAVAGVAPRAQAQSTAVSFCQVATLSGVSDGNAAWGDYDNDGDLDVVVTGMDADANGRAPITLYRNDGGTFVESGLRFYPDIYNARARWADYDKDGWLDLLVIGEGETVLYHNDHGTFSQMATPFLGLNWIAGAAWGDYNNDGYPDLVIAGTQGYDPQTAVTKLYRNDGGVLVDSGVQLPGIYNGDLAWGDFDGDGQLDLAMCGATTSGVAITAILRNDNGAFVDTQAGLEGVQYCSLAPADYDRDGRTDLAVTGLSALMSMTVVYHNDGGSFSVALGPSASPYGDSLAWADADGDGRLDLLAPGGVLYRSTPDGFQKASVNLPNVERGGAAWGDYDGDGRPDLVVHGNVQGVGTWGLKFAGVFRNGGAFVPAATATLTVTKRGSGSGIVTSWAIDCGSTCQAELPTGIAFTLMAQPDPGSVLLGWEGACFGNSQICPLTLTSPTSVTAVFGLEGVTRHLMVFANGPGMVAIEPQKIDCRSAICESYPADSTTVVLTANGDPGYVPRWDGPCAGAVRTCSVAMDAERLIPVSFVPGTIVSVTKTGSGNIVSEPPGIDCGATCAYGFEMVPVILRATPDSGWVFSGWSGACSGVGDCWVPGPDGDASVRAQFDKIGTNYDVTVSTAGVGTVTSSDGGIDCGSDCSEAYPSGTQITLTANAPSGYALAAWGGACSGRGDCTLSVDGPKAVTATFSPVAFSSQQVLFTGAGGVVNDARWGDYDGDGDLDALVFGWRNGQRSVTLFRNDDGVFVDSGIAISPPSENVEWTDYDNDGRLDLILNGDNYPNSPTLRLYHNDGGGFTLLPTALDGVAAGGMASGDYDNDGDVDILVAGWNGGTRLYRNDHGTFTDAKLSLPSFGYASIAWGDYDRDGDLDVAVVDGLYGVTRILRNDGGVFVDVQDLPGGSGSVAWGDYNNDGYLDLAIGGIRSPETITKVYRNDHGTLVDSGLSFPRRGNYVSWVDYDGDGQLDLFVSGYDYEKGVDVSALYANHGGEFSEVFTGFPDSSRAAWGDYDNDGRMDALVMDSNGATLYRGIGGNANTPPAAPHGVLATPLTNAVHLEWQAATDSETPSSGLSYNVRVGTTPGGSEIVSALADPATGFRGVVAFGNAGPNMNLTLRGLALGEYYWAVQAVDTSYAGSPFTEMGTFTVGPRPFPLTVTRQGSGSGSVVSTPAGIECGVSCEASFLQTTAVTLVANAAPGSSFTGWGGACTGTADCTLTMEVATSVTATFEIAHAVSVSIQGPGLVTSTPTAVSCSSDCSAAFAVGTTATFTATPSAGYVLQAWGGDCTGKDICQLIIDGPKSVTAVFVEMPFVDGQALDAISGGRAVWGDYDNDGDLDLIVVGWRGSTPATVLYRNDGGALVDSGTALEQVAGFAAWADYDNDGYVDLLIGGATSTGSAVHLYHNDGGKSFTLVPTPALTTAGEGDVAWGDYDNDGRLDLAIATGGVNKIYRNTVGGFVDSGAELGVGYHVKFAWADYDKDGNLDLVVSTRPYDQPVTKLYRNDGGVFHQNGVSLLGVSEGGVAWTDYDNDGNLDLVVGGYCNCSTWAKTSLYRNDGGVLVDAAMPLGGVDYGSLTWGDYDGDGRSDLFATGNYPIAQTMTVYRNTGTALVATGTGIQDSQLSSVALGDYDNDGRLDLLWMGATNEGRMLKLYHNVHSAVNTPPAAPPSPTAAVLDGEVRLGWQPASDAETPSAGLSYNVRVGTTPGGSEIVSAMADAATGFRRVVALGNAGLNTFFKLRGLAPGTYDWAVQAIDTSFAGSAFSATAQFVVPTPATLSINDVSVKERDAGRTAARFTVTLSPASLEIVTVDYATADGSATAGSDYVARSGSLTFAPGQTSQTISVLVNGDRSVEPNETFSVNLTNPVGATLGRSQGVGTILSDELPPPVTTEDVVWTRATGVRIAGNDLRKTAATRWGNAGAVSTRRIVIGDGYVELVASETTTARAVGLSHGDAGAGLADADFGVLLDKNAALSVYERGVLRGSFGAYATGDHIRVGVAAGVVTYSRNGAVFYTSARTPTYPLRVDAALHDRGATIHGAVISGSLVGHPPGSSATP
jgi:hypothetical protein